jgi:glucosamine--fructose-6-phosphate aminotransferase (isomerizing)
MCGIIGITGNLPLLNTLLESLKRLEYRGYDSAGIAAADSSKGLETVKVSGKIADLEQKVKKHPLVGTSGIGHTRWATHGAPTQKNAHPHATDRVAVVHNGIIENFQELREELRETGIETHTDTDSEVIPLLITEYLNKKHSPEVAVQKAVAKLEGAYAIAVVFIDYPDMLIGARKGSPLAVGYAEGAMLLGSDAVALSPHCKKIAYLEEGDIAVLHASDLQIFNQSGQPVTRAATPLEATAEQVDKGDYPYFMLKEIHEQPLAITRTLEAYRSKGKNAFAFPDLTETLEQASRVTLVACGTSFYAAMVARYWLEQIARVPTSIEIASEFRYRKPLMPDKGMAIFISQSGETADTLAALRYAQSSGQQTIALVNSPASSMLREADHGIVTMAGPEIGVASTKAFVTQLTALACLTLAMAEKRSVISLQAIKDYSAHLDKLPKLVEQTLEIAPEIERVASEITAAKDAIYIGRGTSYAIACEGALKLKEISYIHAEGYAAGELKHGPLALIDNAMPVIVIAPHDDLFEKTASNLEETSARGGRIVLISCAEGMRLLKGRFQHGIQVPTCPDFISPIIYTIPAQLLAYYVAVLKGTNVDQPRNLAKSVTVE